MAINGVGKKVKFLSENRDGTIMVAEEKYRGSGFDNFYIPAVDLKYHKDGTRVRYDSPFNRLEML